VHSSRAALGPTQPHLQCVPGLFPGVKAAGTWRLPPIRCSAQVKERVQLYFYSPCMAVRPVGAELFHVGRQDTTKLEVVIRDSANAHKNTTIYTAINAVT
jgi:hypothetical protein